MKKIIYISLLIVLFSCKNNDNTSNYDDDITSAVDTISTYLATVDSSATSIDEINTESTLKLTYEDAILTTSIYELQDFINENPNHKNIDLLNERLIDLEVDRIYNDENTGEMPSAEKTGYSNSSSSEVSIKNDTSCELIVRYSGNNSRSIIIPSNQSKSIVLSSGNYRVTASACGHNYAGSESLNGNYSSSYYISSSYR